jgi:hypothetical protein
LNRDLGVGFYLQGFFPFTRYNQGISFLEKLDGSGKSAPGAHPPARINLLPTLKIMRKKPAHVLGVADQVPQDGIFEQVGNFADLCDEFDRY